MEHEWFKVQFYYGGYVECACGFIPMSEAEYEAHIPTGAHS